MAAIMSDIESEGEIFINEQINMECLDVNEDLNNVLTIEEDDIVDFKDEDFVLNTIPSIVFVDETSINNVKVQGTLICDLCKKTYKHEQFYQKHKSQCKGKIDQLQLVNMEISKKEKGKSICYGLSWFVY